MKPPADISPRVWQRIPLAKRKLLLEGPLIAGLGGVQSAMITLASELRLHDVSEDVALDVCRSMPFTTGTTLRRDVEKQIPRFVAFAYGKEQPLLSGCPATSTAPSKMRDSFAGYCDEACRASCLIRRARTAPEAVLVGTPYYETMLSPIWLSGRQSGLAPAKPVWTLMASMAVMETNETIHASLTYVTNRLGGTLNRSTLWRHTRKLRGAGMLVLLDSRNGVYRVPPLSDDELGALEARLGVDEGAKWNRIDANLRSLRRNEEWPTYDLAAELNGGLKPEPVSYG